MFFLTDAIAFPPVQSASPEGIVAAGGDLSPERLMLAYRSGIFPWFENDTLPLWWSPDPRMVLYPHKLKVSKSMEQVLKSSALTVTFNQDFENVIKNCSNMKREGQTGTWITEEMIKAYVKLHEKGHAQSVEVWQGGELVGGLYGIDLGRVFCGESMFSKVSNASKAGFITWVRHLQQKDYQLIDCQVYTPHLESLGAELIPRKQFLRFLQ